MLINYYFINLCFNFINSYYFVNLSFNFINSYYFVNLSFNFNLHLLHYS